MSKTQIVLFKNNALMPYSLLTVLNKYMTLTNMQDWHIEHYYDAKWYEYNKVKSVLSNIQHHSGACVVNTLTDKNVWLYIELMDKLNIQSIKQFNIQHKYYTAKRMEKFSELFNIKNILRLHGFDV